LIVRGNFAATDNKPLLRQICLLMPIA